MNRIDLEGRVAIVTGAARGIGRAIADRMSASGARVAIWDIDGAAASNTAASIVNAVDYVADGEQRPGLDRGRACAAGSHGADRPARSTSSTMPASPGPTTRWTDTRSTTGGG